MTRQSLMLTVVLLVAVGMVLFFMGREPICTCGYIKVWEGDNWSAGNSQHISDWYTFSHIIHGFIFFYLIRRLVPHLPVDRQLFIALTVESIWEILENSPIVIDHYRTTTASIDYYGDSILNSLVDVVAMVVGYRAAARFPWQAIVIAAIGMELITILVIRDALILNIVMLVYPVASIKTWQLEIAP